MLLSDYIAESFQDAITHLRGDGCRRLHIIAHSMGARILSTAADRLPSLFSRVSTQPDTSDDNIRGSDTGVELASITFLSPDIEYGEFVERCGPILRSICPLITIYGDVNDEALVYASFFNTRFYNFRPQRAPPGLKENWCAQLPLPGVYIPPGWLGTRSEN